MVEWMQHLTGAGFDRWGWRIPFLASAVLVLIGLYVRLRVLESPDFAAVKAEQRVERLPLVRVLREQPLEVATSAFVRLSEQAPFYLFVTFVLTYGVDQLKFDRGVLLDDVLIAAAIGLVSVPFFGYLSDLIGRKTMYGIGIVLTAVYAFPYFGLLNTRNSGLILLAIIVSLMLHDMQYGPQAALIAENFGINVRYSGAGLGYQLASVIAGGPAPLIAAAILTSTGSSSWISVYMIGCCVLALIALVVMPRTQAADAVDAEPVLLGSRTAAR
jgi:MFS family permease